VIGPDRRIDVGLRCASITRCGPRHRRAGSVSPAAADTLATFLAARSTVLGDLYRYASALLEDRRPEGWQHLAAHVSRELMNRLADHLAEVAVNDPDAPAAQSRLQQIARRLTRALAGDDGTERCGPTRPSTTGRRGKRTGFGPPKDLVALCSEANVKPPHADPTSGTQCLVSYLVRTTPSGNVRVSSRV